MARTGKKDSPKLKINPDVAILCVIIFANLIIGLYLINRISLDFDGFYNLQMPKNLVEVGKYATHFNMDYQLFNPVITTGPAVLLPIALFFMMFGVNYVIARLVMIGLYLLMLIMLYLLVKAFFGRGIATATAIFVGLLPTTFILAISTLGEIPATLFIALGFLMLTHFEKISDKKYLIFSGLFFGLSVLSKQIFIILIIPLAIYLLFKKDIKSRIILPASFMLPLLTWEAYQLVTLGVTGYAQLKLSAPQYMMDQGVSIKPSFLSLVTDKIQLLSSEFGLDPAFMSAIVLMLIAFAALLIIESYKKRNTVLLSYVLFVAASSAVWFLFINRTYLRHVYPYIVLSVPLFLYMVYWLYQNARKTSPHAQVIRYGAMIIAALVVLISIASLIHVTSNNVVSYQYQEQMLKNQLEFIDELQSDVPASDSIGYWGWWCTPEVAFFIQNDFIDLNGINGVVQVEGHELLPEYIITSSYQETLDPSFPQLRPMISDTIRNSDSYTLCKIDRSLFDNPSNYWWIPDWTKIIVNVSESKNYTATFDMMSFYKNRTLHIKINGKEVDHYNIPVERTTITQEIYLNQGNNEVILYTPDGAQSPVSIPELNNPDGRKLSFAFYSITVS